MLIQKGKDKVLPQRGQLTTDSGTGSVSIGWPSDFLRAFAWNVFWSRDDSRQEAN